MKSVRNRHGAGGGLLGVGMAFVVLSLNGQPALLGVAMALLATGIAWLAGPRTERCRP